jgi:hypothetical protein
MACVYELGTKAYNKYICYVTLLRLIHSCFESMKSFFKAKYFNMKLIYTSNVALAFLLSNTIPIENSKMIRKDANILFEIASLSENSRLTSLVYMSLVLKLAISIYVMRVY